MGFIGTVKHKAKEFLWGKHRQRIASRPLDAQFHFDYAKAAKAFRQFYLAHAELKCAAYLGYDSKRIFQLNEEIARRLPDLDQIDVNQYQRFKIIQTHLNRLLRPKNSVLDIGGGHGILSQFMPLNRYFLVEPAVNGISGSSLPFGDGCFDAVVACHVLEHINRAERPLFIQELLRVAKKHVLLFNPFQNKNIDETENLKLIIDVTHSTWAKEHLECGLPAIEEIEHFLKSRGYCYSFDEYGDLFTSMALEFMSYFARITNAGKLFKINRYLNRSHDPVVGGKYPTNIMIIISKES